MGIQAKCDAVGIVVADMAAALAFYRLLGLAVPDEAAPHVEVALGHGMRLLLDTEGAVRSFHPGWEPPVAGARVGLAFAVADAGAVDAAYAELTAAGHRGELPPFDAPWGQRYAVVLDPDGTGVDLFAPLTS